MVCVANGVEKLKLMARLVFQLQSGISPSILCITAKPPSTKGFSASTPVRQVH